MIEAALYDAKGYDREHFQGPGSAGRIRWTFHDHRLSAKTASTLQGASAACIFVNDRVDRACLEKLLEQGTRHVALRCAGFNNVDLLAARELGIQVTRVPAYSPHAVAEHALALLMTLNR